MQHIFHLCMFVKINLFAFEFNAKTKKKTQKYK
jgi:hypothetical protein